MAARNRARYLAPLALVAAIVGVYLVVNSALSPSKSTTTTTTTPIVSAAHKRFAKARFYTVRSGDTLTTIARRTGITLTILEQLNPRVDVNALQTGERLRLRR